MKKIFVLIFAVLICCSNTAIAKNNKIYSLKFNGNKYRLLYSTQNQDFGGYLNEYFKRGETYNIWSEMVALHHLPNAFSPVERIQQFKSYLAEKNCPSVVDFDDKNNAAFIDFLIVNDKQVPIVMEFNIFKYQKSEKSGSVAFQYAKRYVVTNTLDKEEAQRDFEKIRYKMLKKVKDFKIPEVVTSEIDLCKTNYVDEEFVYKKPNDEKNETDIASDNTQEYAPDITESIIAETEKIESDEQNLNDENPKENEELAEVNNKIVIEPQAPEEEAENKMTIQEKETTAEQTEEISNTLEVNTDKSSELVNDLVADEVYNAAKEEDIKSDVIQENKETAEKNPETDTVFLQVDKTEINESAEAEAAAKKEIQRSVNNEKPSIPDVKEDTENNRKEKTKSKKTEVYKVTHDKSEYYQTRDLKKEKKERKKNSVKKVYQVTNDKSEYYCTRDFKKVRQEGKKQLKEMKKQAKQAKKDRL